jgi:hypothetical protein
MNPIRVVPQPNDTSKMRGEIISDQVLASDTSLFRCRQFSLLSCLRVNVSRQRE